MHTTQNRAESKNRGRFSEPTPAQLRKLKLKDVMQARPPANDCLICPLPKGAPCNH